MTPTFFLTLDASIFENPKEVKIIQTDLTSSLISGVGSERGSSVELGRSDVSYEYERSEVCLSSDGDSLEEFDVGELMRESEI